MSRIVRIRAGFTKHTFHRSRKRPEGALIAREAVRPPPIFLQLSLAYRNNQQANQHRSDRLSRFVRFGIQAATARRAWRCSQIALTALIASS
jgi:hypothetical protein